MLSVKKPQPRSFRFSESGSPLKDFFGLRAALLGVEDDVEE